MALSRGAVVEAGLGILDRYGLPDVSMRRVAEALGVQAGALYYHVPNKQSLLAAVADEILAAAEPPPDTDDVTRWVTQWAHSLRRALLRHRDAAELVASARALGLGAVDPCARGRALLEKEGIAEPSATMAALLHFVLGHVTEEQTAAQMAGLGLTPSPDAATAERDFAWGVGLVVRGMARDPHVTPAT